MTHEPGDERGAGPERPEDAPESAAPTEERLGSAGGYEMRFTVLDRSEGLVHLVSEGSGEVFGHPAVSEAVWFQARQEVPDAWEIVDLTGAGPPGGHGPEVVDDEMLAARHFERLRALVAAGFDRDEAMAVVLTLLRAEGPGS